MRDVEVPSPGAGEVVVRTERTAVSPGTELRCLRGEQPGGAVFPFVPGYSCVGVVEAEGEGVSGMVGKRVLCGGTQVADVGLMWGGHVGVAVTSDWQVVPEGLSPDHAVLGRLLGIAWRGVVTSRPMAGEKVAVIGLGAVGQLSARCFRAAGAEVLALDQSGERVALAERGGVRGQVVNRDLPEPVLRHFPEGADIVVDCTGVRVVLDHAVACGRERPWADVEAAGVRVVVQGSYPGDAHFDYQSAFLKEASFYLPRDAQPRDKVKALELMASGAVAVAGLAETVEVEASQGVYERLLAGQVPVPVTYVFDWGL